MWVWPWDMVLHLSSDFPGVEADLFAWAHRTNKQILTIVNRVGDNGSYFVLKGDPWKVDRALDTTNSRCPTPVIEAGKAMLQMQPGQTLKLMSNRRAAMNEVTTWVKSTRY